MKFFNSKSFAITLLSSASILFASASMAAPKGWVEQCMTDLIAVDGEIAEHKEELKSYCTCVGDKLGNAKTSYTAFLVSEAGDKAHTECAGEDEEGEAEAGAEAGDSKKSDDKKKSAIPDAPLKKSVEAAPAVGNAWVDACVKDMKLPAGEGEAFCGCMYEGSEKPTKDVKAFMKTKNGDDKNWRCKAKLKK